MSKYVIELDTVSKGVILNTETNKYVALIETKRPDLGFEELQSILDKVNNQHPQLDDNQKIVLEWLKKDKKYRPFRSIGFLDYSDGIIHDRPPKEVYEAYKKLDFVQQFEVLAAFAQWGSGQEEVE
ncbi:hypothetical protein [Enterococcus sp. C76]|uniref:hypothetical protein n=1 Tax=Enterococcus sp. C76 TaxID=3231334 RepID=UPI00349FDB84